MRANTIWKNVTDSNWVIGDTQFSTNQFLHPHGGSVYYGFTRSTGLNFYESSGGESILVRHVTSSSIRCLSRKKA
ncbi:MAG: DUF3943 domain-containing protein [Nitrospiraceae bacterium]